MKRLIPMLFVGVANGAELANYPNSAFTVQQNEVRVESAISQAKTINTMVRYGVTDTLEARLITNDVRYLKQQVIDFKYSVISSATDNSFKPAMAVEVGANVITGNSYFSFNFDHFTSNGFNFEYNIGAANGVQYQTSWAITKKIDDTAYFINGFNNQGSNAYGAGFEYKPSDKWSLFNNNSLVDGGLVSIVGFAPKL